MLWAKKIGSKKAEVAKVIGSVEPKFSPNAKPATTEKAKQAAEDLSVFSRPPGRLQAFSDCRLSDSIISSGVAALLPERVFSSY
jgi:hypothetical protein